MFKTITKNKLLAKISKFLRPLTNPKLSPQAQAQIHKNHAERIKQALTKPKQSYRYGVPIDPITGEYIDSNY